MQWPPPAAGREVKTFGVGSRQPAQQSTTATQLRPVALQPPLDTTGDGTGKPFVFGARRALCSPAQQLTPPRLTSADLGRREQDTPPRNRSSTAERSKCQGKPFAFSPGSPSAQQPQVRLGGRGQGRPLPFGPLLGARGESAKKPFVFGSGQLQAYQAKADKPLDIGVGQVLLHGPAKQQVSPRLPQIAIKVSRRKRLKCYKKG